MTRAPAAMPPGRRNSVVSTWPVGDAVRKRLDATRSFGVKLWPTLIFLTDGKEVTRLVRPADADEIGRALAQIDP